MINLIIGKKGSGKTKKLIELSNQLTAKSDGNVVLVSNEKKLTFDLSHKVRLISVNEYGISNFCGLYGFVCGICAGNYDVTDIFVDSIFVLDKTDNDDLESFIERLSLVCERNGIKLTLGLSLEKSDLSSKILDLAEVK